MDRPTPDRGSQLIEKVVRRDDSRFGTAILNHNLFDVLAGDRFESARRKKLISYFLFAFLDGWVATRSYGLPRLDGCFSRILEADNRITAERNLLLGFPNSISKTPMLPSSGCDLNI